MLLVCGNVSLDNVCFVQRFPQEDSTTGSKTQNNRCTDQVWARGGNASNNCTVLACLGQAVEFFGTFADDHLLKFYTDDMQQCGINYENCPVIPGVKNSPTSVVICSEESGSRTIIHSNGDLRELSLVDFQTRINLASYDWIHFEGRNENEAIKMMEIIHEHNAAHPKTLDESSTEEPWIAYKNVQIPISVEVEKCRDTLTELFPLAHVLFIGKDFASWQGAKCCEDAVGMMLKRVSQGTVVICPWGSSGAAYGICRQGNESDGESIKKIDAFPPTKLVDSLGAGDTFTATTIFCLNQGMGVEASIRVGCRVASEKLTMRGFLGLRERFGGIVLGMGIEALEVRQ